MKHPFIIKQKHWYDYINPFWYRRRKLLLAVLEYEYNKQNWEEKINQAIKDAILSGIGSVYIDWKE